ncbi:helix-turn-helix domain-containing protein [Hymenobacter sp. GOD-10R]|uniref:helix-turn-helix domain-containing protein n=1 Tax=Hymenobacter sp. GOD-10R TaxID=3093922 RepID=UPI002D792BA9|nr:helix-turn-helix domain-containing protein [Hymenobacter sp. GOD-10R]WRQ31877.1 helix-turn-helix domain-containing protein [Hymenobacter sp. GOD-10R]
MQVSQLITGAYLSARVERLQGRDGGRAKTLDARVLERDHIQAALQHTGGRVSGPKGAALLLGLKATTLEARMKKLGLERTIVRV